MRGENVLANNQVHEILLLGQTSDQFSYINTYVLPEDYKWEEKPSDVKQFFTFEDFVYMIQKAQKEFDDFRDSTKNFFLDNFCGYGSLFKKVTRLGYLNIFPAFIKENYIGKKELCTELEFSFQYYHRYKGYYGVRYSLTEMFNKGYVSIAEEIKLDAALYDFSGDLSIVPAGVNEMFAYTLEKIDKEKDNLQSSFVWLSVYLNDLARIYDESNIHSYGCKDIYDFAEKRFGFGRTSVKNFLAIYDKFIDGVTVKPAFRDYSYSQLTELVSIPSLKLSDFSADMTIKQIREKKKEMFKPTEKSKVESAESNSKIAETVKYYEHQLDESSVLRVIEEMVNPYFISNKEKQSARYDAYEKALNDVFHDLTVKLGCLRKFRGQE